MTTEQNNQTIHDIVRPSASGVLHAKRLVDLFNIVVATPIMFSTPALMGANLYVVPLSVAAGVYSVFDTIGNQRAVNVIVPNENDAIRSHRAAFNNAAGSFIKNQVASAVMNVMTIPAMAIGFMGALGESGSAALTGFGGAFLLAVGGAVTGWRAHRRALDMSRDETAIKIERLNLT